MQHNLILLFLKHKAVSKILSYCAVLVFVFVSCGPIVKANATGVSVPQPFFPITPWSAGNVNGNYDDLTDEQKEIADYIVGAGAAQYGGMSNYWLRSAYDTSDTVESWFKSIGGNVFSTVGNLATALVTAPQLVVSYIGSAIYKASQYNSYSEFETEVENADEVYLPYVPGLSSAWYDFFGAYGSLYQWQFQNIPLSVSNLSNGLVYNDISFTYLSSSIQQQYIQELDNLQLPHVRFNYPSNNYFKGFVGGDLFTNYHNIFADTHYNICYLCDDFGNAAPNYNSVRYVSIYKYGSNVSVQKSGLGYGTSSINISGYSTIGDLYNAICSNQVTFFTTSGGVWLSDYIQGMFYGDSWANRKVWSIDTDLNLGIPDTVTNIDEVYKDILVGIKGLVEDLAQGLTDLKQAVIDNSLVKDDVGELVTKIIYTTDRIRTSPDVIIPIDVFNPVFGENQNGYIWYLWNMTKPLVLYTKDLLNALLFNGNGIAWIIYGVVAIGLIGGLVVKFLL